MADSRYPSVRVYYPGGKAGSFGTLARGFKEAFTQLGVPHAMLDYRAPPGEDGFIQAGGGYDLGLYLGEPTHLSVMTMHTRHAEKLVMVAPNGYGVRDNVIFDIDRVGATLLTPSRWGRDVLAEQTRTRIEVVPHGVFTSKLPADPTPLRRLGAVPQDARRPFLHVTSTASDRKGTRTLLNAWSESRMGDLATLTIKTDVFVEQHLQPLIDADPRLSDSVQLDTNDYDGATMRRYYRQFHLLVQPSAAEGFGLCLKRDTPVTTPHGVVHVQSIKPGDSVLTQDGTWGTVQATKSRKAKWVYKIEANGLPPLLVTPEHPMLVVTRMESKQAEFERKQREPRWKKAEELIPNKSYLVLRAPVQQGEPSTVALHRYVKKPVFKYHPKRGVVFQSRYTNHAKAWLPAVIEWTPQICRLVGYYAAEGSTYSNKHGAMWSFDSRDRDAICRKHVHDALSAIGLTASEQRKKGTLGLNIMCSNSALARWLAAVCKTEAAVKQIPSVVWSLGAECRAAFLEALIRGDGHVEDGLIGFTSVSRRLAFQVRDLWLSLGVPAGVRVGKNRSGFYSTRPIFSVTVGGKWLDKAASLIGVTPKKKSKSGRTGSEFVQHGDTWLVPVKRMTKMRTSLPVYDLQVDKHTMVAGGVVVHNCALEAAVESVPVVLTDCTGHADFVRDIVHVPVATPLEPAPVRGEPYYGHPPSAASVSRALATAFHNLDDLRRAARVNASTVAARWSWTAVVDDWLKTRTNKERSAG